MPSPPLPDGYVDTDERITVVASADVELVPYGTPGPDPAGYQEGTVRTTVCGYEFWGTATVISLPGYHVEVWVRPPFPVIDLMDGNSNPATNSYKLLDDNVPFASWPFFHDCGSVSVSIGPLRLGVRYRLLEPDEEHHPEFAQVNYYQEYRWFADVDTVVEFEGPGGQSRSDLLPATPSDFVHILAGPVDAAIYEPVTLTFAGTIPPDGTTEVYIQLTDLAITSAVVDTDAIQPDNANGNGIMEGSGSDVSFANYDALLSTGERTNGGSVGMSWMFSPDWDVTKFGGATTAARLIEPWLATEQLDLDGNPKAPQDDYVTVPFATNYTIPNYSWVHGTKSLVAYDGETIDAILGPLSLQADWLADHDPPLTFLPEKVGFMPNAARLGLAANETYTPLEIEVASPLSVFRSENDWVSLDEDAGTVSGSVFTVTEAGAVFERTLAEHWRNWTTVGDPDFVVDGYEVTKADFYGDDEDDVWGWHMYAFLNVPLTGPEEAATLAVYMVDLEVHDPHTTGSDRVDNLTITPVSATLTYPFTVPASGSTQFDLLFPAEGAIQVMGRVDKLRLTFSAPGTYTLTGSPTLTTEHDVRLKCDFGPPQRRADELGAPDPDFSALRLVADGAHCLGNWPDLENKNGTPGDGETGVLGGAVRYVTILTGSDTGLIFDTQLTLEQFIGQLNKLEGVTATYDVTDYETANKDPEDNLMGPELAQWLRPVVPGLTSAGGTFTTALKVGPVCARLRIPPGVHIDVFTDWPIWGALEALVEDGGARAAAGVDVEAYRADTLATVATGTTDAAGYVRIVVPANADRNYLLREPA